MSAKLYIALPCDSMMSGSDILGDKTCRLLRARGIDVTQVRMWPDWVGRLWYSKLPLRRRICRWVIELFYINRLCKKLKNGDVVWVNGGGIPFDAEAKFEKAIKAKGANYLFHLQDDWLVIDGARELALPRLELADLVVVPTQPLCDKIAKVLGEDRVVRLEEPIDHERFTRDIPANIGNPNDKVRILWAGNPNNVKELAHVEELIVRTGMADRVLLDIISGVVKPHLELSIEWCWHPFSQQTEAQIAMSADIALSPVKFTEYAVSKGSYKVKTYMASGIAVIASAVGHQTMLVDHGKTGFLANDDEAWVAALKDLITDKMLCKEMGENARLRSLTLFSHDAVIGAWVTALTDHFPQLMGIE